MPNAKFVLKEPNKKGETLIYLLYSFNNERLKFSTQEKVLPKFWNDATQRVKASHQFPEHMEFNQRLNNIETAINNVYRRLLNNNTAITVQLLREELGKEINKKDKGQVNNFIEWMEAEVEILKRSKKHGSIQVYNALLKHLKEFSKKYRYKVTFDTINLEFYEKFHDYLINDIKLLNNTFGKQITTLKTFLNIATEKGVNTNYTYKNRLFKSPKESIDHIYLKTSELDILYNLNLTSKPYLDRVRDLFLIGCHTGLRFGDFTQLKAENIIELEGNSFFNVITNKTGNRVVIPIKPVVQAIWDKYKGNIPRAISNQKMNDYLKELGETAELNQIVIVKRKSGIVVKTEHIPKYKLISSHTARRSFATNAFLDGIQALEIMKITGHRTETSFMKYIKATPEENALKLVKHKHFNQQVKQPKLKAVS